jgi:excisionase family DNA binding protein
MNGLIISMSKQELTEMIHAAVRDAVTEYRLRENEKAEPVEDILNSREAARFLDIKLNTLYIKTHKGELPYMKKGKKVYFSRQQLVEWMGQGRRYSRQESLQQADARLCELRIRSQKTHRPRSPFISNTTP